MPFYSGRQKQALTTAFNVAMSKARITDGNDKAGHLLEMILDDPSPRQKETLLGWMKELDRAHAEHEATIEDHIRDQIRTVQEEREHLKRTMSKLSAEDEAEAPLPNGHDREAATA